MISNLDKSIFNVILFWGLMLLPTLGFSQQEQPKRVTVVVTAREIVTEKEIVQIPADNIPQTGGASHSKNHKSKAVPNKRQGPFTPAATSEKPAIKTAAPISKSVLTNASKTNTEEQTATRQKAVEEAPKQHTASRVIPATVDTTVANLSHTSNQLSNKDSSIVKSKSIQRQNASITGHTKANSFSYIWIGSLLIVAGVVLGLLFGKPAFLISFVGVAFVVLGLLI